MKRGLLALVVVLFASSCAGGDGSSIEALTAVPDRVEEAGSFRMRFEVRIGAPESGAEPQALGRIDGALDKTTGRSTITFWDLSNDREVCRIRTDRDVAYLQVVGDTDGSGGWLRMATDGFGGSNEDAPDDFGSFVEDAEGFIADLRKAGEDVEVVGSEELRGVTTTHYGFSLSPDDLDGGSGPFGIAPEDVGGPVEHDVWIDGDGFPRRILVGLEQGAPLPSPVLERLEAGDLTTSLRTEFLLDLFDFGAPLEVEIPPDGEIEPEDAPAATLATCMGRTFGEADAPGPSPRPPGDEARSLLFRVGRAANGIRAEHGPNEAITAVELGSRLVGDVTVVRREVVTEPGVVSFRVVGPDEMRFAALTSDGLCFGLRNLADPDPGERGNFSAEMEVGDEPVCRPGLFSLEDFGAA